MNERGKSFYNPGSSQALSAYGYDWYPVSAPGILESGTKLLLALSEDRILFTHVLSASCKHFLGAHQMHGLRLVEFSVAVANAEFASARIYEFDHTKNTWKIAWITHKGSHKRQTDCMVYEGVPLNALY